MPQLTHPNRDELDLTTVLQALADPVRLAIVRLAGQQDELPCAAFFEQIPRSTMSHHWRVLREAGIIYQRNHGTRRLNRLRTDDLDARFPGLIGSILIAAEHYPAAIDPRPHRHTDNGTAQSSDPSSEQTTDNNADDIKSHRQTNER